MQQCFIESAHEHLAGVMWSLAKPPVAPILPATLAPRKGSNPVQPQGYMNSIEDSPPDLAWHTAVAIPEARCMLVYGGAILYKVAYGDWQGERANPFVYAYYFRENRWAQLSNGPGGKLPHGLRSPASYKATC